MSTDNYLKNKLISGSIIFLLLGSSFIITNMAVAAPGSIIPLKPTSTFNAPKGLTEKEVLTAIKIGLVENKWKFNSGDGQALEASLKRRSHWLKIKFLYNTSSIQVDYMDSKNLNYGPYQDESEYPTYKPGTIVIHSSYERWVRQVKNSVETEFMRILVRKGLI